MSKYLFIILTLSYLFITGCSSNKIPIQADSLDWPVADIMPSGATSNGKSKVIVRKPDVSKFDQLRHIDLGDVFKVTISQSIGESGAIIVDRDVPAKYKNELVLHRMTSDKKYAGPAAADYLVDIHVYQATKRIQRLSAQAGSSARCHITAYIKAVAKVYKLPELVAINSIKIEGDRSGYSGMNNRDCNPTLDFERNLFSSAIYRAANVADDELKNTFSPVAYVSDVKKKDGDYFFKLSSGTDGGIQANAEATVYSLSKTNNLITKEIQLEEHVVTNIEISDVIGTNYAWFAVDDEDIALTIRIGDYVKIKHETGFFEGMMNKSGNFVQDYFIIEN